MGKEGLRVGVTASPEPSAFRPAAHSAVRHAPARSQRLTLATPVALVMAMLAADASFIAADVLQRSGVLSDSRALLTTERGYGEFFQYVKFGASAAFLLASAVRRSSARIAGWSLLFAVLACDDAFQLHETAGAALARLGLPGAGTFRPRDLGELILFAALGSVVIGFAFVAYRSGSTLERKVTKTVVGGLTLVAFFGVGMDAVHRVLQGTFLGPAAAVVEDGGELLATSLLVAAILRVLAAPRL